jgi:hypothetical protein
VAQVLEQLRQQERRPEFKRQYCQKKKRKKKKKRGRGMAFEENSFSSEALPYTNHNNL